MKVIRPSEKFFSAFLVPHTPVRRVSVTQYELQKDCHIPFARAMFNAAKKHCVCRDKVQSHLYNARRIVVCNGNVHRFSTLHGSMPSKAVNSAAEKLTVLNIIIELCARRTARNYLTSFLETLYILLDIAASVVDVALPLTLGQSVQADFDAAEVSRADLATKAIEPNALSKDYLLLPA